MNPARSIRQQSSLPLERRLPLTILGLLLFVLTISVAVSYYEVRRAAQVAAGDRLAGLSHVLASLVQPTIALKLAAIRHAAADSAVIDALEHPGRGATPAALKVLAPLAAPSDSLTPPQLLDLDGRPIQPVRLDTPLDLENFRDQFRGSGSVTDSGGVGRLYTSGGHTTYWVAAPVRTNGQLLGYVAQERRFNTNPRASAQFRDLIGSDINLYFRDIDDDTWVDLTGASHPAPLSSRTVFDSLHILTFAAGGEALASTSRIPGTPILVTVVSPMSSLLAGPQATIRTLAVIALLLAVLGALIAWVISRQLTRPLVELTSAAEAIAEGQYAQRVAARRGDEIGRLGAAFNRMAAQVEVSSTESEQAVVRLTRSAATQEFLADASRMLAASLSDESLFSDLAHYCVPTLADYCSIQVIDRDGGIRRLGVAYHDAAREATIRELVSGYDFRVDGPGLVPDVIRSQRPLRIPVLDIATLRREAANDTVAALLDEVSPTAFMCVPLVARGRALGALTFTMTDSGRSFSDEDLELAMELARRTAVAIDNAMIYRSSLTLRLEAEAASSAKSDFLAKMSHEIRTPINAMMGYADLLEMGIAGPVTDAQSRHLSRIRSSGAHLTSLVNEILDLAKIEAGQMAVEPTVGVAGDALDAALGLVRPQAAAKGVNVVNGTPVDSVTEYLGDPQRVQQILTNLLSNAVKFTPAGGSVTVSVALQTRGETVHADERPQWACIVVQDTGIGIAPEDLERIFQPFIQVENGYTRNHGGTGLGLTISQTLARMMGGELAVESALGSGSRFTLWLPSPNSCIVNA